MYSDIGLLTSQLRTESVERMHKADFGAYKGAVADNMVACALYQSGYDLFYYRGNKRLS